jgi:hypothetical protein
MECKELMLNVLSPILQIENKVFFSFFRVVEHRWNEIDRGERKFSEKNLSQ